MTDAEREELADMLPKVGDPEAEWTMIRTRVARAILAASQASPAPAPVNPTMTREQLIAAAESIGMRPAAPAVEPVAPEIPVVLFEGYAVYKALTPQAVKRTSLENVSDVLDAVVRRMRFEAVASPTTSQAAPKLSHSAAWPFPQQMPREKYKPPQCPKCGLYPSQTCAASPCYLNTSQAAEGDTP